MADNTDNVLELLDSIDSTKGEKHSKDGEKRIRKPRKPRADDSDILGFLDEIRKDTEATSKPAAPVAAVPRTAPVSARPPPASAASSTAAAAAVPIPAPNEVPAQTHTTKTTATEQAPAMGQLPELSAITSWWSSNKGGLWDSATSVATQAASKAQDALKQAEEQIKNLQHEAGSDNADSKFSINMLQNRFTSVLNSIVPPIQKHEQLNIHIFHDMVGYSSIDKIVHSIFERIMEQVEGGGDLNMIVQRGKERHKASSEYATQRQLNALRQSTPQAGEKLAKASIDDFRHAQGDDTAEKVTEYADVSEIFISLQPVVTPPKQGICSQLEHSKDADFIFVVYLADFQHNIELSVCSQAFPSEWADWLDAPDATYADSIADPRLWALDWIEDGLGLAVGTLAQKYITMRMGLSNDSTIN